MTFDVTFINMNLMLAKLEGFIDTQRYMPLGLMYISSYLKQNNFSCQLKDYQFIRLSDPFYLSSFKDFVGKTSNIVGFSCMANLLPFTILCCQHLKLNNPRLKIVLGGVGPSPVAQEIIDNFPFIDYVVVGEGEKAMLSLMKGKVKQKIIKSGPFINLDDLPLPDYQLIDPQAYDAAPSIITSRGCSYNCQFCTEPTNFGNKVRMRSVDNVIKEIEEIYEKTGRTLFLFQDDNFILNKERLLDFAEAFSNLNFKIKWKSFARIDLIDDELLNIASKSGCVQIRFGIENGSNSVLKELKKGFSIEEAYETVKLARKFIDSVHVSFMWGFPFETLGDLQESLNWMKRMESVGATILLFQWAPLAGSVLYERYKQELDFVDINYSNFVLTGHEVRWKPLNLINPKHKPIYDLIEKYPKIFPGFYCVDYKNNILRKLKILIGSNFLIRKSLKNKYDL